MDIKDSLFVEKMKNHINLLEICLENIDKKFKPIENDKLFEKLIYINYIFNNSNQDTSSPPPPSPSPPSPPPPSPPPPSSSPPSSNLKINNDDDDEEEEDYI